MVLGLGHWRCVTTVVDAAMDGTSTRARVAPHAAHGDVEQLAWPWMVSGGDVASAHDALKRGAPMRTLGCISLCVVSVGCFALHMVVLCG